MKELRDKKDLRHQQKKYQNGSNKDFLISNYTDINRLNSLIKGRNWLSGFKKKKQK